MSERQTNYTIMEGYEIPSGGKIYDKAVNPHVELRSMTARDEMKRLSPSTTPLKTLADIIEGCMIEKPAIHVYEMSIGDYEFLLHKLRIVTYGEKYQLTCQCTECREYIEAQADLGELSVRPVEQGEYEELRSFNLPVSNHLITLKHQTPKLLEDTEMKVREMKRKYPNAGIDFETYCKILCAIESVDGNRLNQFDLEQIINSMAAKDMQKILNNTDALGKQFGIENVLYITCPKCGAEVKTFFRYGPEFFRPSNI